MKNPSNINHDYYMDSDILWYLLVDGFTGTFTLSNLGMFGVDRFDAILPPGTVSIVV